MPDLLLEKTDVLILAGGRGKRLQQLVNDKPKPMAGIGGRPFLDVLIDYASGFGLNRFILGTGYKAETIAAYYEGKDATQQVLFSTEAEPLGTAGAVKNAEELIQSNPFMVMNGDSFCRVDLRDLLDFHIEKNALLSVALVATDSAEDFGTVELDDSQEIVRFEEKKAKSRKTFVNAGIYLFQHDIFSMIPAGTKYSLEYDLFPGLVGRRFYGFVTEAELIDIGTPRRYYRAVKVLSR